MRSLLRRLRAWLRWRSVVALALTTLLERVNQMSEDLHSRLADIKADLDTVKATVEAQTASIASLQASLAAAQAAGSPPSAQDVADIKAIHAELHAILGKPAPADDAPDAAPAP